MSAAFTSELQRGPAHVPCRFEDPPKPYYGSDSSYFYLPSKREERQRNQPFYRGLKKYRKP